MHALLDAGARSASRVSIGRTYDASSGDPVKVQYSGLVRMPSRLLRSIQHSPTAIAAGSSPTKRERSPFPWSTRSVPPVHRRRPVAAPAPRPAQPAPVEHDQERPIALPRRRPVRGCPDQPPGLILGQHLGWEPPSLCSAAALLARKPADASSKSQEPFAVADGALTDHDRAHPLVEAVGRQVQPVVSGTLCRADHSFLDSYEYLRDAARFEDSLDLLQDTYHFRR